MINREILHYKIIKEIGRGGMGVVYLAEDTKLNRQVAIKFLPPHIAADSDERKRFELEAQAAAALNHPNIATIHAIEHDLDDIFLVMEYIEGTDLKEYIQKHALKLETKLDLAIQMAEGIQTAHEKGIVHRDIKSTNVRVTEKNKAKILDFGLAKFRESGQLTKAGTTVGTAAYMSPEQAQGREVDPRTDIWSFGVVLYEMFSGKLPFSGEYESAVTYAIINENPRPIQELVSDLPSSLVHVLDRTLEKDPDDRYQSMDNVVRELRWLQKQLVKSGSSSTYTTSQQPAAASSANAETIGAGNEKSAGKGRPVSSRFLISAVAVVLLVVIGWALSDFFFTTDKSTVSFENMKFTRLTNTGDVGYAAMSPDGKYIVYVQSSGKTGSFWLKQLATGQTIRIVEQTAGVAVSGSTFSPDGNFVYYVMFTPEKPNGALYRIPTLGGNQELILENIISPVSFSPDGLELTYLIRAEQKGEESVVIAGTDGSNPRRIATRQGQEFFVSGGTAPAWSPDGKRIVVSAGSSVGSHSVGLLAIDVDTRKQEWVSSKRWDTIGRIQWLTNGSGLIMPARDQEASLNNQLWYVTFPEGKASRITNDMHDYGEISFTISTDNNRIAVLQTESKFNLWRFNLNGDKTKTQISTGEADQKGRSGLAITTTGGVVYGALTDNQIFLWLMQSIDQNPVRLHAGFDPYMDHTNNLILFASVAAGKSNIWRMDLNGKNAQQLTFVEDYGPSCAPDGQWVYYISFASVTRSPWRVPVTGGDPEQVLLNYPVSNIEISPDSKRFVCIYKPVPDSASVLGIFNIGEQVAAKNLPLSFTSHRSIFRWTADGQGIYYIDTLENVSNIWCQPADGRPAYQITDFTSEYITSFDVAPDDSYLVCARGTISSDIILLSGLIE